MESCSHTRDICWCWLGSKEAHVRGDWCALIEGQLPGFDVPPFLFRCNLWLLRRELHKDLAFHVRVSTELSQCWDGIVVVDRQILRSCPDRFARGLGPRWNPVMEIFKCPSKMTKLELPWEGKMHEVWEAHFCHPDAKKVSYNVYKRLSALEVSNLVWDQWEPKEGCGRKVSNPKRTKSND